MKYNLFKPNISNNATVIITHGIAEYSKSYKEFAEHLKDQGFTVITYDLYGHGLRDGKRGYVNSYMDFINDLKYLITEVKTDKVFLYGHSMGGIITNIYQALYNNFDGVIIQASPTNYLKELKFLKVVPRFLTNNFKVKTDFNDPNLVHENTYIKDEYDLDYFYFKMVSEVMFKGMKILINNISKYHKPILMIYSENDKLANLSDAKAFYENIKSKDKSFVLLNNSFHNIHQDIEKTKMFDEVTKWLKERI